MTGDPIWGQLLLQLVLILINAFFASTEIALLSVNEARLEKSAEDGDKKAAVLLKTIKSRTASVGDTGRYYSCRFSGFGVCG